MDQPYALIALGRTLRLYATAYAAVQASEEHASPASRKWVAEITAAMVMERIRDE